MADYITEMANQIVAMSRRIDAIESDRVARMAELERTFNAHRESVYDRYNHGSEKFNAALDRIHTLECGEKELYARCQEVAGAALEALRDRDRQDRWHATYNAVVGFVIGNIMTAREDSLVYDLDRAHRAAAAAADRAHGPLEAKAPVYPDGMPIEQDTLPARPPFHVAQERANAHTAFAPNVEALVKAARRAYDVTDADTTLWAELRNALKPFEASRGGE